MAHMAFVGDLVGADLRAARRAGQPTVNRPARRSGPTRTEHHRGLRDGLQAQLTPAAEISMMPSAPNDCSHTRLPASVRLWRLGCGRNRPNLLRCFCFQYRSCQEHRSIHPRGGFPHCAWDFQNKERRRAVRSELGEGKWPDRCRRAQWKYGRRNA